MGRIKTTLVKRKTKELLVAYGLHFSKDFDANKKLVDKFAEVHSKKLRNSIAGFITRKKKTEVVI